MKKFLLALLLGLGSLAEAQSLPVLPRSTRSNGLGDTSLYMTSDTARRTRAVTTLDLRRVLAVTPFDSLMSATKLRFSGTTSTITGGAGGMTIQSGTGADRRLTFAVTDASSAVQTPFYLRANAVNGATFRAVVNGSLAFENNGNTTAPSLNWADAGATGLGLYRPNGDTVAFVAGSTSRVKMTTTGIFPSVDNTTALGNSSLRWSDIRANTATFSGAITVASCTGCGGAASFPLLAPDGSSGAPSYSFSNSTASGMFFTNAGSILTLKASTVSSLVANQGAGTLNLDAGAGESILVGSNSITGIAFTTSAAQSLEITGGATATLTGGAGSMTIQAGTGNSRDLTLQTTTSAGAVKNTLKLGFDTSATFIGQIKGMNGDAGKPSFSWTQNPNSGFYWGGSDTVSLSTGGSLQMKWAGGASGKMIGGAGSMTILGGTGNSRRLHLQTTTSAGAATEAIRFNELQQGLFTSGTSSNPSIAFAADSTLGWFRAAATDVRFTQAGNIVQQLLRTGSGSTVTRLGSGYPPEPQLSFFNDPNTGIFNESFTDTLGVATGGIKTLAISGGAAAKLIGGAGNMTILSGTGASRTLTFQTTNASSVPQNNLVLNADGSITVTSCTGCGSTPLSPFIMAGNFMNSFIGFNTTSYLNLGSTGTPLSLTDAEVVVAKAASSTGICITTTSTQTSTGSLVATLWQNGATSGLAVTVAASAVAGTYCATGTTTLVAGDKVAFQIKNNSASVASATIRSWGVY